MTSPQAGWYPDPGGTAPLRWWDGQAWTAQTTSFAPPASETVVASAGPAAPAGTSAARPSPRVLPRNHFAHRAFLFAAFDLVLWAFTGFAVAGIAAISTAFTSLARKERLSGAAIASAVLAAGLDVSVFYQLGHHHHLSPHI